MARTPTAATPQSANLSEAEIRLALPKLKRRLKDVTDLDVDALTNEDGDNELDALRTKINTTLRDIFGSNSIEFGEYQTDRLDDTPVFLMGDWPDIHHRRDNIKQAVRRVKRTLQGAIEIYEERLTDDGGSPADRSIRAYEGLDLHSEIARAASKLFRDGHYSNSVEAAVKALNGLVRMRSGKELDGVALMENVFSVNNPILRFNDLSDQSDKDEQKGFMQLFCGAVTGLRNPRAHSFIHDKPERALEFIAFIGLLAKLLDEAEQVP